MVQWSHMCSGGLEIPKSMGLNPGHSPRGDKASTQGNGSTSRISSLCGLLFPINSRKKPALHKKGKKWKHNV